MRHVETSLTKEMFCTFSLSMSRVSSLITLSSTRPIPRKVTVHMEIKGRDAMTLEVPKHYPLYSSFFFKEKETPHLLW